jgi:2,4-dienoyl-CoA reductase-like NADH-dependent reductase (Old Yellow Enzyme family)
MKTLFDPVQAGSLHLRNRLVMAPLTRNRAPGAIPTPLMADYYAQRAGAGLIISEATSVSPQGVGYDGTPGIWSAAQVHGWQLVTDAVHAAGGRIFLQLFTEPRSRPCRVAARSAPARPAPSCRAHFSGSSWSQRSPVRRVVLADAQHLPHGRSRAGDRHLKFHESRDNLPTVMQRASTSAQREGLS